jgi:hypothetical protein
VRMHLTRLRRAAATTLLVVGAGAPGLAWSAVLDPPSDVEIVEPTESPSPEPTTEPSPPPPPPAPPLDGPEDSDDSDDESDPVAPAPAPATSPTPTPSRTSSPTPTPTFVDWRPPTLNDVEVSDGSATPWGVLAVTSVGIIALTGVALVRHLVLAPRERRRLRAGGGLN